MSALCHGCGTQIDEDDLQHCPHCARSAERKDRLGVNIGIRDTVVILRCEDDPEDWTESAGELAVVKRFSADAEGLCVDVEGKNIVGRFYRENVAVVQKASG